MVLFFLVCACFAVFCFFGRRLLVFRGEKRVWPRVGDLFGLGIAMVDGNERSYYKSKYKLNKRMQSFASDEANKCKHSKCEINNKDKIKIT